MTNETKTLVMMVGLPRSGKTTLARKLGFPIVNPDSIRLALHGQPFIAPAEPLVWVLAKYMVKALFLAGHEKVILDATNTTRKRREEWKSKSWIREYAVFQTDKETCIERAKSGGNETLIPIIEGMADRFEPVGEDETDGEKQ